MALPRISIVTPAYRAEQFIESTITSVVSQGYPDLEYIVLDCTGDATADILRRHDESIHHWRSAPDEGQYAAVTEGFAMATGEVLGWLNADDILLPRSLFVIGEIFAQFPEIDWITTNKPGLMDASGALAHFGYVPGFNARAFLDGFYLQGAAPKGFFIQQEATFFRRSLWEKAGACIPPFPLAGDFALWCEFYKHAELVSVAYPLAAFRVVEGQRSEAIDAYLAEGRVALANLRQAVNYAPSAPFPENPVYPSRVIMNQNPRQVGAGWTIVPYNYAPMTDISL